MKYLVCSIWIQKSITRKARVNIKGIKPQGTRPNASPIRIILAGTVRYGREPWTHVDLEDSLTPPQPTPAAGRPREGRGFKPFVVVAHSEMKIGIFISLVSLDNKKARG